MSKQSFLWRRWKLILNIATLVALVALAYAIRDQLAATLHNLTEVKAWVLLLIIPVEIINYVAQTKMYQRLFAVVDEKLSFWSLFRVCVELNFVNHLFPSGGVSGLSYFGLRMRSLGVRGTKATLVHTLKLLLRFVMFEVMLLFGMIALAYGGRTNSLVILIGGMFTMVIFFGTGLFMYIIGSQKRVRMSATWLTAMLNGLIRVFWRHRPAKIDVAAIATLFDDFHRDYVLLRSRYRELKAPFLWAVLADLTEVAVVYVVYMAFGSYVNVGAVILAYGVANFAGFVSVLPGGVGVYEVLMTAVLVATGIPAEVSLPVTVMYHVLNTAARVVPGYPFYHHMLQRGGSASRATATHG